MVILDYDKKLHKQIINACVVALKQGKVVVYPTDTCYGLAVDATNIDSIKKLYKVKGRGFNKASSVVVPSVAYAKKIVLWNKTASALVKKFWPGAITLVLKLKVESEKWKVLSAKTGFLGLRMPKYSIALDLAKKLNKPITATSANLSGMPECYSAKEVLNQFTKEKLKPDIIINAGKLKKQKPSTVAKIVNNRIQILRPGPITQKQITNVS